MCTLILLQRPDHDWPLLLAANRDEMTDQPASGPGSPRLREVPPPDPESSGGWSEWTALLASRSLNPTDGNESAMTVVTNHGYGTVSSSLVAQPTTRRLDLQPVWLFAAGRPDLMTYESVPL